MHPERVVRELLSEPPTGLAGVIAEVRAAGLALQRRNHVTGTVATCAVRGRLRDDDGDVPGAIALAQGNDDADGARIRFALQFRRGPCPPPSEARTERGEPVEQIVRGLLADRASVERLYGLAAREPFDRIGQPPHAGQIDARKVAVVVRVDVAERFPFAPLVAGVARL